MTPELCLCTSIADRECHKCGTPLCDLCDAGDWQDQCAMCPDCKNEQKEHDNQQVEDEHRHIKKDLTFIRENYMNAPQDLWVNKFVELATSINWDTGHVCSEVSGMSNERYREIKKMLHESLPQVKRRIEEGIESLLTTE